MDPNVINSLIGIAEQFQAANITAQGASAQAQAIRTGGEIAAQGAALTASGFRASAEGVRQATEFNLQVDKINVQRQLKATSRQYQRLLGRQLVQQATSGLSLTSKSFLQLRNEALDSYGSAMLNLKVDAENKRRARIYESQLQVTNLENQARAADYQAASKRVLAANKASEAAFAGEIARFKANQSALKAAPTILSQLFQGS